MVTAHTQPAVCQPADVPRLELEALGEQVEHDEGVAQLMYFGRAQQHQAVAPRGQVGEGQRLCWPSSGKNTLASHQFGMGFAGAHQMAAVAVDHDLGGPRAAVVVGAHAEAIGDRKSTRLNSSHVGISYAVFCLKKKMKKNSDLGGSRRTNSQGSLSGKSSKGLYSRTAKM